MPRYVIQRNADSCGPIVVINVSKWCGKNLTIKNDFKRICKEVKYIPNNGGTNNIHTNTVMQYEFENFCKIKKLKQPYKDKVAKHIKSGGAAVISYCYEYYKKEKFHICIFTDINSKNEWIGHNATYGKRMEWVKDKEIHKMFYEENHPPKVWLLKKKGK